MEELKAAPKNFIEEFIEQDIEQKGLTHIQTRFPPEPNGYLHIGHAKALFIDFSMAEKFGGKCNLRFDDTNPTKEDVEYVDAIKYDIHWLGFDWDKLRFGSDYFDTCYELAVKLIQKGVAYVDDLSKDEMREYRGTLTEPGKNSPFRDRSIEENLELFERMKNGEFPDGSRTLRAKIDMASPNINLRDPALYRILHIPHHQTGDKWCIYPMYDFAHPLEDAFEGVTHSFCTLEFEIHRPLYDWVLQALDFKNPPVQTEFSRLNLTYTVMSKRKLLQLVKEHHVSGWDDPRMPTICGMRRRGIPAAAIRKLCRTVGVTKFEALTDIALLEHCVREELNATAPRYLAVLDPLKVTITNYPAEGVPELDAVNNPEDPSAGSRKLAFTRELYIEKSDFMLEPVKGYFRLAPGREVRLRYGYFIKCEEAVTDADGNVVELKCTFDPETRGGSAPDGRKVKGTIHWVSAETAIPAEVRLYDRLFTVEQPGADGADFLTQLNPGSVKIVEALIEPAPAGLPAGSSVQFERSGYYCVDPDSEPGRPVFNRTVTLKDSWGNKQGK